MCGWLTPSVPLLCGPARAQALSVSFLMRSLEPSTGLPQLGTVSIDGRVGERKQKQEPEGGGQGEIYCLWVT